MNRNVAIVVAGALFVGAVIARIMVQSEEHESVATDDQSSPAEVVEAEPIATQDSSTKAAVREAVSLEPIPSPPDGATPLPGAAREARPQGLVIVSVVDARSAKPVPDVTVTVGYCDLGHDTPNAANSVTVVDRAKTDANGEVRISAAAGVEVQARLDRTLVAEPVYGTPTRDGETKLVLRVEPSAKFTGRVEARDGKPIENATVTVAERVEFGKGRQRDEMRMPDMVGGETDSQGRFVLAALRVIPGAKYSLTVNATGYAKFSRDGVLPIAGAETGLDTVVMDESGVQIVGTIVGDSVDIAGQHLDLISPTSRRVELEADGTFAFRMDWQPTLRFALSGFCLNGSEALSFTLPKGTTAFDCGTLHAAAISTHYTGRVVRLDGVPASSGSVTFGATGVAIAPDGTFDLRLCSPGPLRLAVTWSSGGPESTEVTPSYVFAGTTGNELRVQPRGILVRIERAGVLTGFEEGFVFELKRGGDLTSTTSRSMPAEWRMQPRVSTNWNEAGPVTVTLTVEGKTPVTRDIVLGVGGLNGPEVVVTFDHSELGLE